MVVAAEFNIALCNQMISEEESIVKAIDGFRATAEEHLRAVRSELSLPDRQDMRICYELELRRYKEARMLQEDNRQLSGFASDKFCLL